MGLVTTSKLIIIVGFYFILSSCECANNVDTEKEKSPVEFAQLNVVTDRSITVTYNSIEMFNVNEFYESSLYQKYGSGNSFLGIKEGSELLYQSIINLESNNYYSLFLLNNENILLPVIAQDKFDINPIIRIINNSTRLISAEKDSIGIGSIKELVYSGNSIVIKNGSNEIILNDEFKEGRIYNYIINENDYEITLSIP